MLNNKVKNVFFLILVVCLLGPIRSYGQILDTTATGTVVLDSTDKTEYWFNDIKISLPPTSICIGQYIIPQDSLLTMTDVEIDNFIKVGTFLTSTNIWFKDEVIERFAEMYIPKRFKVSKDKDK